MTTSDDKSRALAEADSAVIGRLHYLCYKPACVSVTFQVQITYHDGQVTPAYLRQAGRELALEMARLADEMDAGCSVGVAYGD